MHDSFETKDEVVVVMELAEGELFQVLEGMDIKTNHLLWVLKGGSPSERLSGPTL